MQLQRHPHIHLADPYGTFRRPEWALLDAAAACRASARAPDTGVGETAAPPPAPPQNPQRSSSMPDEVSASEYGGMVTEGQPMHQRQTEAMQGLLALVDVIDGGSGRVPPGDARRPPNTSDDVFWRRVWLSSAAAATLSFCTVVVRL